MQLIITKDDISILIIVLIVITIILGVLGICCIDWFDARISKLTDKKYVHLHETNHDSIDIE